jgi:hypothetical protein
MHVGIRAPVIRPKGDLLNDRRCGFDMIRAREIDRIGVKGVIEKIVSRVNGTKVYISVDIDVLDPAFAPGEYPTLSMLHQNGFVQSGLFPKQRWSDSCVLCSNRHCGGWWLDNERVAVHFGWLAGPRGHRR